MSLQLDILEYIHSKGYVHADIKGANLLLGLTKKTENQVYLLDYGLAGHYFTGNVFKPDPKKAHNGTIEYLSTDAHLGGIYFKSISISKIGIAYIFQYKQEEVI